MLDEKYIYKFRNLDHFGAPLAVDNFLNDEEIEMVKDCASWYDTISAGVARDRGSQFFINPDIRKGDVVFIPHSEKMDWLFAKLRRAIDQVNDIYFRYNIVCLECFQFSVYNVGDHYDYHRDVFTHGINPLYEQRKLSFTVQLTDPSEYEGGDLEFYNPSGPIKGDRTKGSMTVFPSYHYHRVTPVTKGQRIALVGWIVGPDFQ
jgi:PKHD-type hydroxylase